MQLLDVAAYTISGFLSAIDTLAVIFGAILIMNTLKQSGAMGVINRGFTTITDEPRIQLIIIGFMFGASKIYGMSKTIAEKRINGIHSTAGRILFSFP